MGHWSRYRSHGLSTDTALASVPVTTVLLATDSDHLYLDVDAALARENTNVLRVRAGSDVLPACRAKFPDLVLLDLQIGNMGGVATSLGLKQEQESRRLPAFPVGLLLDRSVDSFLASQSRADGWLVKPLDPLRLRKLATALLTGGTHHEPEPVDTPA